MTTKPQSRNSKKNSRRGTIRPRGSKWQADFGRVNGKRLMKSFPTKADADNWLREQVILLDNQGHAAFKLSESARLDAEIALSLIQDIKGATLENAARFYIQHKTVTGEEKSVSEVAEEYIAEARDNNLRPRSIQDLENRLKRFTAIFNGKLINEITRKDADNWIKNMTLSNLSKRHYRTVVGGLFNFAIDQEYIKENPFALTTRRRNRYRKDEKMPECLTAKQVEKVMYAAQAHVPEIVPALAIGFFAGLRTSEVRQIDWSNIDLESGFITVLPEVAKKRRARHVTLEPNLIAWLVPYRKHSGHVAPQGSAWRRRFDEARKQAGIMGKDEKGKSLWPDNAMRHSFASYHVVKHGDAARTALQLGHRDTALLFDHYRSLVKPQDAEKFWSIKPKSKAGVIRFQTAG